METEKQRIEELVKQLNAASAAYYNGQDEIMPNYEWDALFRFDFCGFSIGRTG